MADRITEAILEVEQRIQSAASAASRDPASIKLIAVTKTHPVSLIEKALAAGLADFGENRVQEALPKIEALSGREIRWHLIGHLQSNKAKQAAAHFDLVHSVDSKRLASELNRHAALNTRKLEVLVQVNVSGEESKSGIAPGELEDLLDYVQGVCPSLLWRGLMTIAPLPGTAQTARRCFAGLREIAGTVQNRTADQPLELSMGMTGDFEVAIEEGATLVRIGSAIFGSR
jgi:pyridoxal phosphate enzyme (YggS family)